MRKIVCIMMSYRACRNGGHINPPLWHDWTDLKERHGEKNARLLINFRLAHVREMLAIAQKEDIMTESQLRETEHVEVHLKQESFDEARQQLEAWKADMPEVADEFTAREGAADLEVRPLPFHESGPRCPAT